MCELSIAVGALTVVVAVCLLVFAWISDIRIGPMLLGYVVPALVMLVVTVACAVILGEREINPFD